MNNYKRTRNRAGLANAVVAVGIAAGGLLSGSAIAGHPDGNWGPASPLYRNDGVQVPGGCPIESPTGRFIYTARRPDMTDLDIAVNERLAPGASFAPGNVLPEPLNDPGGADDFCPTPLRDGEFFFVSAREGGCGGADIYRAVLNPATGWSEPENLGCAPDGPNTPGTEFSPAVIDTIFGRFLFFSTEFYTENQDIYGTPIRSDGSFGRTVRLPWPINTEYDDRQPNVSQDGREIVFASNRPTSSGDTTGFDIFYARKQFPLGTWRRVVNLSETVPFDTVDAGETRPSFSWDGERIVYGSGGVWLSERNRRSARK